MTTAGSDPNPQTRFKFTDLISSIPSFAFSALYFYTWVQPTAIEEKMVSYLTLVMVMEFFNVHSSVLIENVIIGESPPDQKARFIVGLGLFYTLFVGGISLAYGEWWPVLAFWGLTLNRLLGVLLGKHPTGEEKARMQISWAMSLFFYLLGAGVTTVFPVPAFGITAEVVSRQEFTGGGLWELEPQTVIAFGFLYFAALGCSELFSYRWIPLQMTAVQKVRNRRGARSTQE
jgi:hypothetical protein